MAKITHYGQWLDISFNPAFRQPLDIHDFIPFSEQWLGVFTYHLLRFL